MKSNITDLIFKTPEKWIHLREIARKLRISPNSVRKYMGDLKKKGIIEQKKEGNMILFRANFENEYYKHEKIIHNLSGIYKSGIIGVLRRFYNPSAIVLFGSYSRGEDTSTSDIDIGIITTNKKKPNLKLFEKKLSRRIELSLFTTNEVSTEFFNNIINGIVLEGHLKK